MRIVAGNCNLTGRDSSPPPLNSHLLPSASGNRAHLHCTHIFLKPYGTIPVVRETGGLKDTVEPYNMFEDSGNGFTFDRYEPGLLLDAINRAKTLYFTSRESWDKMVVRDMEKDVSWTLSASQYRDLYLQLTQY